MIIHNCYVSASCNQVPTVADCKNNLIAYGSCNAVLIYDPNFGSGGKVTHTLVGHTKRVNSVRWLRGKKLKQELISGSSDGSVIVWTFNTTNYESTVLKGNNLSVSIVDGLYRNEETIICSASMDRDTVKIWVKRITDWEFKLNQQLNFGNHSLCVGLRIHMFPNTDELLFACALDSSKIQLFVENSNGILEPTVVISSHEDWVRRLDFTCDSNDDLLLATCSQDWLIKLWRIKCETGNEIPDVLNQKLKIKTKTKTHNISLESVLAGHEGWVYSVNWSPVGLQLLSASIDKSMILWEFDSVSGLWIEKIRVGEVGGNTLGFYGGFFGSDGKQIFAHSYHGSFHIWTKNAMDEWDPCVTVGGHFGEVVDLAWEPKGEFVYSVSSDQTTRIHAPFSRNDKEVTWHEIARPQVHGYDMSSLAVFSRYKFASGAEEKVIRVFEAPETYIANFKRICKIADNQDEDLNSNHSFPKGASVPSLGLSNKAVYSENNLDDVNPVDKKNPFPEESLFKAQILTEPPTEEALLQNTLWPEVQKLYGHGYEVFCLAASPDGKYLASASKSTKSQHAAIFLWDTSNWQPLQKLISHTLTVVQMQFSPDSQHLLSVSRDRRWSIFTKNLENKFELMATTNKDTAIHARIIWTCAWTHDSKYFATGSRDGKVVIWHKNESTEFVPPLGKYRAVDHLLFPNESVTALAFSSSFVNSGYFCAIGFEKGEISLYEWKNDKFCKFVDLSISEAHHLTVRKLAFRPVSGRAGYKHPNLEDQVVQLASCSSDTSVRIFNIFV